MRGVVFLSQVSREFEQIPETKKRTGSCFLGGGVRLSVLLLRVQRGRNRITKSVCDLFLLLE